MQGFMIVLCDPGGARTLGPLIKSQLLYQLSYGVGILMRCKCTLYFYFLANRIAAFLRNIHYSCKNVEKSESYPLSNCLFAAYGLSPGIGHFQREAIVTDHLDPLNTCCSVRIKYEAKDF